MTTHGSVTSGQERYYAYGKDRLATATATVPTDNRFTGQKEDASGLVYMNARYYDPVTGQFVSPDTLVPDATNLFDYNRYMYVRGNPLRFTDPSGHRATHWNGDPDDGEDGAMFTGEMIARITLLLLTGVLLAGCTIRPFLPFIACQSETTGQEDALAQAVLQVQPASLYLPDLPGGFAPISANNIHQLSRLGTITIPDAHLDALAYSADGKRLAVAIHMNDATYAFYVLMQQAANRSVKIPQDAIVYDLAWGKRDLLAVSKQGIEMEIWQTDQGVRLCNVEVAEDAIDQLQFSPDSTQLAIASSDKTARLINLSNGRVEHVFVHQAPVALPSRLSLRVPGIA